MAAENKRSEQKLEGPEPENIIPLLQAVQRQIEHLFYEMEEILHHPATRYEHFPRLDSTLRVYWPAIQTVFRDWKEINAAKRTQEFFLDELELHPLHREEIFNPAWRDKFHQLTLAVKEHLQWSHSVLLPELERTKSLQELMALGQTYKKALKGQKKSERRREVAA